jgi:HSP20 family protein
MSTPRLGPASPLTLLFRAGTRPPTALARSGAVDWSPPTNVYETDDGTLVEVEVAGLAPEDYSVRCAEGLVVIRGVRRVHATSAWRACRRLEIAMGGFHTEVVLGAAADPEGVETEYRDGLIRVHVPWHAA